MRPDPDAVRVFLQRLDRALDEGRIFCSDDALESAGRELEWEEDDVYAFLRVLDEDEYHRTEPSRAPEGGTIWVFLPMLESGRWWIRLCERENIVVVSFHRG